VRSSVDVHNFLIEQDVPHEVFLARGRLRSSERLAAVLDLPREEVGKVRVFEGPGGPVAAVVPSGTEPDGELLQRAVAGGSLQRASEARASELTEYLPESIPPAGLPSGFNVVVERSLARNAVLYFPAGEPRAVLKIRGTDLVAVTEATVASIVRTDRRAG